MTGSRDLHGEVIAALDRTPKDWACTVVTDEKPPRLLATRAEPERAPSWSSSIHRRPTVADDRWTRMQREQHRAKREWVRRRAARKGAAGPHREGDRNPNRLKALIPRIS